MLAHFHKFTSQVVVEQSSDFENLTSDTRSSSPSPHPHFHPSGFVVHRCWPPTAAPALLNLRAFSSLSSSRIARVFVLLMLIHFPPQPSILQPVTDSAPRPSVLRCDLPGCSQLYCAPVSQHGSRFNNTPLYWILLWLISRVDAFAVVVFNMKNILCLFSNFSFKSRSGGW